MNHVGFILILLIRKLFLNEVGDELKQNRLLVLPPTFCERTNHIFTSSRKRGPFAYYPVSGFLVNTVSECCNNFQHNWILANFSYSSYVFTSPIHTNLQRGMITCITLVCMICLITTMSPWLGILHVYTCDADVWLLVTERRSTRILDARGALLGGWSSRTLTLMPAWSKSAGIIGERSRTKEVPASTNTSKKRVEKFAFCLSFQEKWCRCC